MPCGSVGFASEELYWHLHTHTYTLMFLTHTELSLWPWHFQVSQSAGEALACAYLSFRVHPLSHTVSVHGPQDPFPPRFLRLPSPPSVSDTPCQFQNNGDALARATRESGGHRKGSLFHLFLWKISLTQMPNQLTFHYEKSIHIDRWEHDQVKAFSKG